MTDFTVNSWHEKYLGLAQYISKWSKDPSRKVGAVIVRPDNTIVSLGYNGFAKGIYDSEERLTNRDIKYELVVHAEINAIISAKSSVEGCTLYSTLEPCSRCMAVIINSGIKQIVTFESEIGHDNSKVRFDLSEMQAEESGIKVIRLSR